MAGLLAHERVLPGEPDGPAVAVRAVAAAYAPSDLTASAPPPDAEIPALAGTDSPEIRLLGGSPATQPARAHEASPLHRVTPGAPPFHLCHGTADRLVDRRHSVRLHERLLAEGVDSELYLLPGFGHSFLNPATGGDVDAAHLLDAGRLAAEEPVDAVRYGHGDPQATTFGFDAIAAFLARHLIPPAVGAA
jgi:acetyl esterase/lipase